MDTLERLWLCVTATGETPLRVVVLKNVVQNNFCNTMELTLESPDHPFYLFGRPNDIEGNIDRLLEASKAHFQNNAYLIDQNAELADYTVVLNRIFKGEGDDSDDESTPTPFTRMVEVIIAYMAYVATFALVSSSDSGSGSDSD